MKLTFENFFTHFFLLHHKDEDLDEQDQTKALVYSIALGIFTAGTVHATCAVLKWCIQHKDQNEKSDVNKIDTLGQERILQNKGKEEKEEKEDFVGGTQSASSTLHKGKTVVATTETSKTETPNILKEEKVIFLWKRKDHAKTVRYSTPPPMSPPLWTLDANGKLDSKNPRKFLKALLFLDIFPFWVNGGANAEEVREYFMHILKTDFSHSNISEEIVGNYQGILTQYEPFFSHLFDSEESCSFLVSLKRGDEEIKIPKNLLISQSPVYQTMLESALVNEQVIDFDREDDEELREQFQSLTSYFLKGEISISGDNVLVLSDYAHKYEITHLQEGCMKFLAAHMESINEEDMGEIFQFFIDRKVDGKFIKKLSQSLKGDNFVAYMRFAFKHKIKNLLLEGLIFSLGSPEDPSLKKFSSPLSPSPSNWFRSPQDKNIVRLIELGAKCQGKSSHTLNKYFDLFLSQIDLETL